jgi:hypothetical protein
MTENILNRLNELKGELIRLQAVRGEADAKAQKVQVVIAEFEAILEEEKRANNG